MKFKLFLVKKMLKISLVPYRYIELKLVLASYFDDKLLSSSFSAKQ
jgi:hypothetical protein